MCEGSLEPVAERVFGGLPYDAFLVEWDDLGRDGGFEPVRFLRAGSVMVMGIVSSKVGTIGEEDDLLRRMDEAASVVGGLDRPRDQLAVRVRERHGRQRDRRGRLEAEARAGGAGRRPAVGRLVNELVLNPHRFSLTGDISEADARRIRMTAST